MRMPAEVDAAVADVASFNDRAMMRRGFTRYPAFHEAMVPQLQGRADLEAMFPTMLAWFDSASRQ